MYLFGKIVESTETRNEIGRDILRARDIGRTETGEIENGSGSGAETRSGRENGSENGRERGRKTIECMKDRGTVIRVSNLYFNTDLLSYQYNCLEPEAEKHMHQERARDREARERVVRRLGVRGGSGTGVREQRSRHERKKHRETVDQEGSPRKRSKRNRHGIDAKSPSLL